jgi:cobalt/nickel transport system permease protein
MKWPAIFLLPLAIIVPFTAGGDKIVMPFLSSSDIAPSSQGIILGILLLTRGLSAAIVALVIVSTAPFTMTIRALEDLGLPDSLAQLFLFTYRYVFLLSDQLNTMSRSMKSKGFVKRSDLKTLRVLAMVLTMLFIRSYERALGVYYSMLSRGYSGELTGSDRCKIKCKDFAKSLLVVGAAFGICVL